MLGYYDWIILIFVRNFEVMMIDFRLLFLIIRFNYFDIILFYLDSLFFIEIFVDIKYYHFINFHVYF